MTSKDGQIKLIIQSKNKFLKKEFPVSSDRVLKNFSHFLYDFEKKEINQYLNIFYIGMNCLKRRNQSILTSNMFDDAKGDYKCLLNDHIAYRYEILNFIGRGTFGSVIKVFDHKRNEYSAMKIIKSSKKLTQQAFVEVKMLKYLKEQDPDDQTRILKIKDFVIFRNHVCIIFELLNLNLYDELKNNNFRAFPIQNIKKIGKQLFECLVFLKKHSIIHCDIKPENILYSKRISQDIKLIDFGSSCFYKEKLYTYIQSRYYRAPEVILGYDYEFGIDVWSAAVVLVEIHIGQPLFPGQTEQEMISMMLKYLEPPTQSFLKQCCRAYNFFDENMAPLSYESPRRRFSSMNLERTMNTDDKDFLDFIRLCLTWEPEKRLKPEDAILHPFLNFQDQETLKTNQDSLSLNDLENLPSLNTDRDEPGLLTIRESLINEQDQGEYDGSSPQDINFGGKIYELSRGSLYIDSKDFNKIRCKFD